MTLNTPRVRTLQDRRDFPAGREAFDLKPVSRCEAYHFIEAIYQQCLPFGVLHSRNAVCKYYRPLAAIGLHPL